MKLLKFYLLTIAALLCSLPISAFNIKVGGIYYDNTSNTELTVAVTYLGSFSSSYPDEYSGNVNIPEKITYDGKEYTVTSIGSGAFSGCSDLKCVTIPNSVTSIGEGAFEGCHNLTNVNMGNSVTSIGVRAFYRCYSLTSITIPNSVTSIGGSAFEDCSGLTSINIPNSVTSIGGSAFEDCSGLTSITIPNSVTSIGRDAFYGTGWYNNRSDGVLYLDNWLVDYKGTMPYNTTVNIYNGTKAIACGAFIQCSELTSVTIPNSVTSIGSSAFYGCSALKSVTIPNTVTSIESGAFFQCSGLTSVTIPNSVTSIGKSAFSGCSGLTSVAIGNSVTNIGSLAFEDCSGLTAVHISDLSAWCKIKFDHVTSNPTAWARHLYLNGEEITKLVIPAGISSIGDYAFFGCSGLTSVTIPNSVTSIGNSAFEGCSSLTSATIPNSVTSIGNSAFEGCSSLTSATIPNSVTSIGNSAFISCSALKSVTIPNSVTSIGSSAFYNCSGLTSVNIPNSVTSIGNDAFERCSGLASIKVESGNTKYDSRDNCNAIIETNTNTLIVGCMNTVIPNSVTSIGGSAFSNCYGLTSINIPNSVTSIGDWAFDGCSGLTSVTIPNSVTSIGNYAFYGTGWYKKQSDGVLYLDNKLIGYKGNMPSNTSIVVKNGTTEISGGAFSGCSGLTSITIPNSVTSIGDWAFEGCSGLTSVTIPNSVTSIERSAFYGCSSLTSVTIPDSVTSIGQEAFSGCSGLTNVIIPNSVTSIEHSAFRNCSGLTSVSIGKSVTSIEYYAFSGCSNMSEVHINDLSAWCKIKFEDNPTKYAHHIYYNGEELKKLIIPDDVTSIGESAFEDCSGLTSVTIGNSVTSIGESAFRSCSALKSVTIPNSVTSIERSAFSGCSGLTSVTIPNSVTSIGDYAFSGCSGLMNVNIPYSVTSVGVNPFYNTGWYKSRSHGVIYLDNWVIDYKPYEPYDIYVDSKIRINEGTKGIAAHVFSHSSGIISVTIPNTMKYIGHYAFLNCDGLANIVIPDSVTNIGASAFADCTGLTKITIGNSVKCIGDEIFDGCDYLESIYLSDISIWCSSYMGSLGTKSIDGKKIYLNGEEVRKLIIPETVSKIEKNAFEYCCDFTSVTIPSSVISIGDRAFYNCIGLDSVYVMKKNPIQITYDTFAYRSSIDIDNLVSNNAILFVPYGYREKYMLEEGWSSFYNIEEMPDASWVVPDTIMSIGINFSFPIYMNNEMELSAFQCDIYIPEGITLQKNSKGKYDITLDSERSDDHTLSAALQPDGSVRVVVVSMTSAPLFGTEGPLFHLNLLAGEELGTYTIDVKNISVSDATGNLYNLPNVSGTVEIYYKPGDANGDGSVVVNDAVLTVNKILGTEIENFKFRAADMNSDGNILVNDVVLIVNTILGTSTTTAALAPRHMNAFETLSVSDSRTAYGMTEFGITLSNASRYIAMQFDMELAEGADIADIKVSMPTDHSVAFRRIDDTTVRVVVTSLTNEALAEGAQLSIGMKDAAGKTVAFTNGRAACNNGQMVGIMPGSTVLGGITGIDGVNAEFAPADVYSIDGRIVKKNATTLDGLQPGVYVINGRKVVVER